MKWNVYAGNSSRSVVESSWYLGHSVLDFLDYCNIRKRVSFDVTMNASFPNDNRDLTIFAKFWYIPFANYEEQRPPLPKLLDDSSNEAIIRCYWQNRLVPWTVLHNLALFADVDAYVNRSAISSKWRRRLVGILLLDWNVDEISNNKLRFTFNLKQILNNKCFDRGLPVSVRYDPVSAVDSFAK
jgi:hypothetical protein